MIGGIDTTFLVQLEIREAEGHARALAFLNREVLEAGETLALSPQVLTELIHVVSDPARFQHPLSVDAAVEKAEFWWQAAEIRPVFPTAATVSAFARWMRLHGLGRKRVLDTFPAATYVTNGIGKIVSTDARDYRIFKALEVVDPLK